MTSDDDNESGRKATGLEKQELYAYIMLFVHFFAVDARLRDSA